MIQYVIENSDDEQRFDRIKNQLTLPNIRANIVNKCQTLLPKFVLYNNYLRVHPSIHLDNLAKRIEHKVLDDDQYDRGNICLLKFLGFDARKLATAGAVTPQDTTSDGLQKYKDALDNRDYRLNAASIRLTNEICRVWNPVEGKDEANKLRIKADGQYLKVVVEDSLVVEVELDQRSEGFQWLVSFFIVFFSEITDAHENTILLLDEPGLSLHGLKQAEFRETLSRLSENNQTIFTTHSPFLVGANELDRMSAVSVCEECADKIDRKRFNVAGHTKRVFGMYGGEVVKARLRFDNNLINPVLDRFGTDVVIHENGDNFDINVEVSESPVFLSWIAQFGSNAGIVAPDSLREAIE